MTRAQAEQLTGEIVFYVPLFALAVISGIKWPVFSSMLTFSTCKWAYNTKIHFHFEKSQAGNIKCVALTYGTFFIIAIMTLGFGAFSTYLANQPMIPILLAIGATLLYAYAGDIQADYYGYKAIAERPVDPPKPFKCKTATEQELRVRCRERGIKIEDEDFIVRASLTKTTNKEFACEFTMSESYIKTKKRRLIDKLEN
jgi:hypothetical protein